MKFGIVTFPGSNCDADCFHVVEDVLHEKAVPIWHEDASLQECDCVILPGGFAHGDYLRAGALAKISPVMKSIVEFSRKGGLVLGSCNGFQILTEADLLPGALLRNSGETFVCDWVHLRVENSETPFTREYKKGQIIRMPIAHGEGRYYYDARENHAPFRDAYGSACEGVDERASNTVPKGLYIDAEGFKKLEKECRIVFRYCDSNGKLTAESNPNGSFFNIAGICNKEGNVLGLMPHPERCSEKLLHGEDGLLLFQSIQKFKESVLL